MAGDPLWLNQTAIEIVVSRVGQNAIYQALTNWSGSKVRNRDLIVTRNCHSAKEVHNLGRGV